MCICKQKSKKPAGTSSNFNYVFECVSADGVNKEVRVTSGNDIQAKKLAKLECEISNTAALQKAIRENAKATSQYYTGTPHSDLNFSGRLLLISDDQNIYSFDKNEILKRQNLPGGRIALQVRLGAVAYKSTPFTIGISTPGFHHMVESLSPSSPLVTEGFPRAVTKDDIKKIKKLRPPARTLESVASNWTNSCSHGDLINNNCAHHLSDAFIKAGFTELTRSAGNTHIKEWCDWDNPPRKPDARPIRAENMKNWFASMATLSRTTIQQNNGFWAVYQLNETNGRAMFYYTIAIVK